MPDVLPTHPSEKVVDHLAYDHNAVARASFGHDVTTGRNRLVDCQQQTRVHLRPADQQKRPDRAEGGLAELPRDQRFGDVQRQSHHADEDQQPSGRTQLPLGRPVQGEVPGGQQQDDQHRQVDHRRHPDQPPICSARLSTLPNPNTNVSPTTTLIIMRTTWCLPTKKHVITLVRSRVQ